MREMRRVALEELLRSPGRFEGKFVGLKGAPVQRIVRQGPMPYFVVGYSGEESCLLVAFPKGSVCGLNRQTLAHSVQGDLVEVTGTFHNDRQVLTTTLLAPHLKRIPELSALWVYNPKLTALYG